MVVGQPGSGEHADETKAWESVTERELRIRGERQKQVVTVEQCGRIIGKIISPVEGDIFGRWRGAVYLARD